MIWAKSQNLGKTSLPPQNFLGWYSYALRHEKFCLAFWLAFFFGLIFWKKLRDDRQILSKDLFFFVEVTMIL